MFDRRRAIGYMRVSTPRQATNGQGLVRQKHKIHETAEKLGLKVIAIYEDTASAGGSFSDVRRDDLQDALKLAKLQDMPIIVSELNRLTREPSKVDGLILLDGVQIISAKPGEMLSAATVREVIERAQRSRINISKGTAKGHAGRKAKGEVSGHAETLEVARQNSLTTRKERAHEIRDLVASVLQSHPEYQTRTAAEVARLLNELGILSGWRRPFNTDTVRRVLRAAKKEIEERRQAHEEDDPELMSAASATPVSREEVPTHEQHVAELDALDLSLEEPMSGATGADAEDTQPDQVEDYDEEQAELDRALEEADEGDWVPTGTGAAQVGEDFDEEELADLDRALHEADQGVPVSTSPGKTPRKRKPAGTKSSTATLVNSSPIPSVAHNPVPETPTPPEQPVVEATPPVADEKGTGYENHPGYGIF